MAPSSNNEASCSDDSKQTKKVQQGGEKTGGKKMFKLTASHNIQIGIGPSSRPSFHVAKLFAVVGICQHLSGFGGGCWGTPPCFPFLWRFLPQTSKHSQRDIPTQSPWCISTPHRPQMQVPTLSGVASHGVAARQLLGVAC